MAARPADEGSAERRPFSFSLLRRHAAFLVLLAIAASAIVAFAWQRDIATIGDDSVSYLMLAQHIAPATPAAVERWVSLWANFPPLFPLALALSGGAHDLLVAHLVVAAFAILSILAIHRLALARLARPLAALAVCVVFLATPNAWVSVKGILSEPMFLFLSVCALVYHARHLEDRPGSAREWLAFGVLLGLALLTRMAGIALVAAFAAHACVRLVRGRGRDAGRVALAALPAAAMLALWLAWRPGGTADAYRATATQMIEAWISQPLATARVAASGFLDGWIACFLAQSAVGAIPRVAFAALGLLAIAGSVRAALRDRLEGWYALAGLALTFGWVFDEDNTRRLLYPLLPVLMVNAATLVREALPESLPPRARVASAAALAALPVLLCLPAAVVLAGKALERAPFAPGAHLAYADTTTFYTTINLQSARVQAAHELAVLEGFDAIAQATPPGARVMWMRPEYVAVLAGREGVPYYFSWDERRFARALLEGRVEYLVVAAVYKTDLHARFGDPMRVHPNYTQYTQPVLRVRNVINGSMAFELARVEPAAVKAFLERGAGG